MSQFNSTMSNKAIWFNNLSANDVQYLLHSVDLVLFDIDGTLLINKTIIPGADKCVSKLRQLGKRIGFATNNSIYPLEVLEELLQPFGVETQEILTPNQSVLAYLKNFDKDIFFLGSAYQKELLQRGGLNVISFEDIYSGQVEDVDLMEELSLKTLEVCKNVGIVYAGFTFNVEYAELQAAQLILNHIEGVGFLCGPPDDMSSMDGTMKLIGSKFFLDGLQRWTNKAPLVMAKPSPTYTDTLLSWYKVDDASRVLMVGDNIAVDIGLAVYGGFKSLLVLTGAAHKEDVDNWKKSSQPDYIADSLEVVFEKIHNM